MHRLNATNVTALVASSFGAGAIACTGSVWFETVGRLWWRESSSAIDMTAVTPCAYA